MSQTLGQRPTNQPLPTGMNAVKFGQGGGAAPAYPPNGNFLDPGDGSGGEIGPFSSTQRFILRGGANYIVRTDVAGWVRYDCCVRILINYATYGADLNGINFFQKANSVENHSSNGWYGSSIEGMWYCEANTNYWIRFLSLSDTASTYYYQHQVHYNMWGYTVGEGMY